MTTVSEKLLGGYVSGAADAGLRFNCARCGEDLTDPASIEHGWGPICRKLSNAALASCIPANVGLARDILAKVNCFQGTLAEAFIAVYEEVALGDTNGRTDWRGVVHVLVRLIAYGPDECKDVLCEAIEALGYGVLAAVARKDASPSKAEITFANGRVVLQSKRNPAALEAVRAVQGRKYDPDTKTWSFPLAGFDAVVNLVRTYFPMSKLDMDALTEEVAKLTAPAPEAPRQAPVVAVVSVPGGYEIRSPFNREFIADLKCSLPWQQRRWNGSAWVVTSEGYSTAMTLIAKHYGAQVAA
jgi:hypothetical protein